MSLFDVTIDILSANIGLIVVFFVTFWFLFVYLPRKPKCFPPGPKGLPILGVALSLGRRPDKTFRVSSLYTVLQHFYLHNGKSHLLTALRFHDVYDDTSNQFYSHSCRAHHTISTNLTIALSYDIPSLNMRLIFGRTMRQALANRMMTSWYWLGRLSNPERFFGLIYSSLAFRSDGFAPLNAEA